MALAQILLATRPITLYSGSMPLLKKKDQVGREIIEGHAPAEIIFHVGEAVSEGKRQLGDRVGAGLGDMIAADGDAVEIADFFVDEPGLYVAHEPEREFGAEDTGVLGLIFLEDVGLYGPSDLGQGFRFYLFIDIRGNTSSPLRPNRVSPDHCCLRAGRRNRWGCQL
jgi:hypothetical protein